MSMMALSQTCVASTTPPCKRVVAKGRGTCLAKFDVEGAFRTVPVHPWLLGMQRRGSVYVDKVLPFGLRSASNICNAIADAQMWIFEHLDRVEVIHYLDDFLVLGAPGSSQCEQALTRSLAHCQFLGVLVAAKKTEGPGENLTFLGIELNTQSLTV